MTKRGFSLSNKWLPMRSLALMANEYQFWMGGILATQLEEITDDPKKIEHGGFWATLISFEGARTFARFGKVEKEEFPQSQWEPIGTLWDSSLNRKSYVEYVSRIREAISLGGVYQVNACRELRNNVKDGSLTLDGLFSKLLQENPAPYASYLNIPGIEIASASPELFLSRSGSSIKTSPIKGTIRENESSFGEKDKAENLMIVDLMRNDLGRICKPGTVDVSELFRHEKHPGLVHLVSDVAGELNENTTWAQILSATTPPGSVSGAPKSAALTMISQVEEARGPYCGALGWINGSEALLSVAIRTFWKTDEHILRFGTGAGITWGSDPELEWEETQLKARKLISIAGGALSDS
jgi:para-aminobenzoate synthetase component I